MSTAPPPDPDFVPLIALVHRANRALQNDMVRQAHQAGYTEIKPSFNYVFATLDAVGNRAVEMAAQAGITRQSMGEVIREMVELGLVEMRPDPDDRRAKLVSYTDKGLAQAREGFGHILDLEQKFTAEFGKARYATVRHVLERVGPLLDEIHANDA
ncbi:MAG: MarR family winged helix-turn-helix transcriptional regulator [Actinomycetales bacterium]